MDYADGGDLSKKILEQRKKDKFFPEEQILDWFTQICLAIKHIHDKKILHRDIKSQNIFLTKNNIVKLGDFGIAKCFSNTIDKAKTIVGTPYYLSPEIIRGEPYDFKSDIWALGVLLYEMCMLKMPFDAPGIPQLYMKINNGNFAPFNTNEFSSAIKNLICELLNKDTEKRPKNKKKKKNKLLSERIGKFLNKNEKNNEFSHTVLHGFNVLSDDNNNNYNSKNTNRNNLKNNISYYRDKEIDNLKKGLAGIAIDKNPNSFENIRKISYNNKKNDKVLLTSNNINNNNNNNKKTDKKIIRNNTNKKEISERNSRFKSKDISDKDSKDNNSKVLKTDSSINNGSKNHKNGKYSERSSKKKSRDNHNLQDFVKKMRKQNKKQSKELGVIWMKGMENILDDNEKENIIIQDIKKHNKEDLINNNNSNYQNKTNNNDNSLLELDKLHCEDVTEEEVQNLYNNLMINKKNNNNLNYNFFNSKNNHKEININDEILEDLNNDLGKEIVFDMANLIKSQINDDMTQYDYDNIVNFIKGTYDKKGLANIIIEKAINKIPDIYYLMLVEKITVN